MDTGHLWKQSHGNREKFVKIKISAL